MPGPEDKAKTNENTKADPNEQLTGEELHKAAAKFAGIKVSDVFHASYKGNGRFGVVTRDGRKFTKTPEERAADEKAAEAAAAARVKAREARAARRK